jgi:hypothetical protein
LPTSQSSHTAWRSRAAPANFDSHFGAVSSGGKQQQAVASNRGEV